MEKTLQYDGSIAECDLCGEEAAVEFILFGALKRRAWRHVADQNGTLPVVVALGEDCRRRYAKRSAKRTKVFHDRGSGHTCVRPVLRPKLPRLRGIIQRRWFPFVCGLVGAILGYLLAVVMI